MDDLPVAAAGAWGGGAGAAVEGPGGGIAAGISGIVIAGGDGIAGGGHRAGIAPDGIGTVKIRDAPLGGLVMVQKIFRFLPGVGAGGAGDGDQVCLLKCVLAAAAEHSRSQSKAQQGANPCFQKNHSLW